MSRLIDGDALKDRLQSLAYDDWTQGVLTSLALAYREVADMVEEQPEVQLSPIEEALHGLSPEEQADFMRNLMRYARRAYTDSRTALIQWLEEGSWNGKVD